MEYEKVVQLSVSEPGPSEDPCILLSPPLLFNQSPDSIHRSICDKEKQGKLVEPPGYICISFPILKFVPMHYAVKRVIRGSFS